MRGLYQSVKTGMIVDFEEPGIGTVVDNGSNVVYRVGQRSHGWATLPGHWIKVDHEDYVPTQEGDRDTDI